MNNIYTAPWMRFAVSLVILIFALGELNIYLPLGFSVIFLASICWPVLSDRTQGLVWHGKVKPVFCSTRKFREHDLRTPLILATFLLLLFVFSLLQNGGEIFENIYAAQQMGAPGKSPRCIVNVGSLAGISLKACTRTGKFETRNTSFMTRIAQISGLQELRCRSRFFIPEYQRPGFFVADWFVSADCMPASSRKPEKNHNASVWPRAFRSCWELVESDWGVFRPT